MQKKSQDSIDNELEVFDSDLLLLLNKEYNYPEKVEFSRNNFSIYEIKRIIDNKEIILDPDFQRKSNIWKLPQKSKLIESILMAIPLPLFYFLYVCIYFICHFFYIYLCKTFLFF